MKKSLIVLIILLALSGGLWWWSSSAPKTSVAEVTGQEQGQIRLTINFGPDQIISTDYPYSDTLSANLLTITQSLASQKNLAFEYKDYGDMGKLVTKIGDKSNGQDQKYWQFFVNGEQPLISADKYSPKIGEQIEWRFAESTY